MQLHLLRQSRILSKVRRLSSKNLRKCSFSVAYAGQIHVLQGTAHQCTMGCAGTESHEGIHRGWQNRWNHRNCRARRQMRWLGTRLKESTSNRCIYQKTGLVIRERSRRWAENNRIKNGVWDSATWSTSDWSPSKSPPVWTVQILRKKLAVTSNWKISILTWDSRIFKFLSSLKLRIQSSLNIIVEELICCKFYQWSNAWNSDCGWSFADEKKRETNKEWAVFRFQANTPSLAVPTRRCTHTDRGRSDNTRDSRLSRNPTSSTEIISKPGSRDCPWHSIWPLTEGRLDVHSWSVQRCTCMNFCGKSRNSAKKSVRHCSSLYILIKSFFLSQNQKTRMARLL